MNYVVYKSVYFVFSNLVFASGFGYLIGLLVSFIFAKVWVFRNKSTKRVSRAFYLFCLIYLLGGIEMFFVIILMNQIIRNSEIAWFFGALVAALNNYLGSKYISFK